MLTDDCGDGTHICPGSMSAPGHPQKRKHIKHLMHISSYLVQMHQYADFMVGRYRKKCSNANDADNICIAKLTK